ncbi:unnamed protein product [Prorocentrum cordatum]|uniref:Uncharacterized protein n=1 Tax=Prorocentrum cordatum TaxID=2364126 RepID=A0ABN9WCY3_9DINO|nr:unnamed protein product [Polarella glacialis]
MDEYTSVSGLLSEAEALLQEETAGDREAAEEEILLIALLQEVDADEKVAEEEMDADSDPEAPAGEAAPGTEAVGNSPKVAAPIVLLLPFPPLSSCTVKFPTLWTPAPLVRSRLRTQPARPARPKRSSQTAPKVPPPMPRETPRMCRPTRTRAGPTCPRISTRS